VGLTTGLVGDATDVLIELATAAASARDSWPASEVDAEQLRAVFEAVRNAANESRAALAAVRARAIPYRDSSRHLHVAGGRIVRMVVAGDQRTDDSNDDIPC
jgi:hypothetical protein